MLYHSSLPNFPKLRIADKKIKLNYSPHAETQAFTKYGIVTLPEKINFSKVEIFEIETDNQDRLLKVCIRMKFNDEYDIYMPILVNGYVVKTVWLNRINDAHVTLDAGKYDNGKVK
jgi:hypothetical protein